MITTQHVLGKETGEVSVMVKGADVVLKTFIAHSKNTTQVLTQIRHDKNQLHWQDFLFFLMERMLQLLLIRWQGNLANNCWTFLPTLLLFQALSLLVDFFHQIHTIVLAGGSGMVGSQCFNCWRWRRCQEGRRTHNSQAHHIR